MIADHIPFVSNEGDCKLLRKFYSDSIRVRVSLENLKRIASKLPSESRLWLDGGIDGLDNWRQTSGNKSYKEYIEQFSNVNTIGDPDFQKNPDKELVKTFVRSVMDACCKGPRKPDWLSIPQLPLRRDLKRNKMNRFLAEAAGEWKVVKRFRGKMILPIVLTHQNLVNNKTQRKVPLSLVESCYERGSAGGVWVSETSLNDQGGGEPLERRFKGLIQFHQELNEFLPSDSIKIAGPYWGMNLILWARGLVDYPAIGVGRAYRYYIPGGPSFHTSKDRFAIPPLRRQAVASSQLENWLKKALIRIPQHENSYAELDDLSRRYRQIRLDWKSQLANFYKGWFDQLAEVSRNGRALALYQQLSSAYVLGKSLTDLPKKDEKTAKRPERVAQQLMLHCL